MLHTNTPIMINTRKNVFTATFSFKTGIFNRSIVILLADNGGSVVIKPGFKWSNFHFAKGSLLSVSGFHTQLVVQWPQRRLCHHTTATNTSTILQLTTLSFTLPAFIRGPAKKNILSQPLTSCSGLISYFHSHWRSCGEKRSLFQAAGEKGKSWIFTTVSAGSRFPLNSLGAHIL